MYLPLGTSERSPYAVVELSPLSELRVIMVIDRRLLSKAE